jgi:hypothetical protein
VEEVERERMPLPNYLLIHPEARLSTTERDQLIAALRVLADQADRGGNRGPGGPGDPRQTAPGPAVVQPPADEEAEEDEAEEDGDGGQGRGR